MNSKELKILIVDDFVTARNFARKELIALGYENIDESPSVDEAISRIKSAQQKGQPYQIILCDWQMPEKSGLELLSFVKADPDLKNTPFMMVTSESETDAIVQAISLGASDYLTKPFIRDNLKKKLTRVFSSFSQRSAS